MKEVLPKANKYKHKLSSYGVYLINILNDVEWNDVIGGPAILTFQTVADDSSSGLFWFPRWCH